ncbi:MAG: hypothetical protein ACTHNS_15340 [Marmoricola sp.]
MFDGLAPTAAEVGRRLPGDDVVPDPDVVMDRAFTLAASPGDVWPWLMQLGKDRAGWYLPRRVERFVPPARRALRRIDPAFQELGEGDVIPDYGGPDATFEVVHLQPPEHLVHRSQRHRMSVSWAIVLSGTPVGDAVGTRVHLRLRLGPVRRVRLARVGGGLVDLLTIAGLAAGLRERVG